MEVGKTTSAAVTSTPASPLAAAADDPLATLTAGQAQLKASADAMATSRRQQKKAAAKEKLENIKKQMDALRLLERLDPKSVAKQAAKMARDLADAAKDYADSREPRPPTVAADGTEIPATGPTDEDMKFAQEAQPIQTELKNIVRREKDKAKDGATGQLLDKADDDLRGAQSSLNAILSGDVTSVDMTV